MRSKKAIRNYTQWCSEALKHRSSITRRILAISQTLRVIQSDAFDSAWYSIRYQDIGHMQNESRLGRLRLSKCKIIQLIARFFTSSAFHYVCYGQYEDRWASAVFDTRFYINHNHKARQNIHLCPVLYYQKWGRSNNDITNIDSFNSIDTEELFGGMLENWLQAAPVINYQVVLVLPKLIDLGQYDRIFRQIAKQDIAVQYFFFSESDFDNPKAWVNAHQVQMVSWKQIQEMEHLLFLILDKSLSLRKDFITTATKYLRIPEIACVFASNVIDEGIQQPSLFSAEKYRNNPEKLMRYDTMPLIVKFDKKILWTPEILQTPGSVLNEILATNPPRLMISMPYETDSHSDDSLPSLLTASYASTLSKRLLLMQRNYGIGVMTAKNSYLELLNALSKKNTSEATAFIEHSTSLQKIISAEKRNIVLISISAFSCGGGEIMPIRLANELHRSGKNQVFVHSYGLETADPKVRKLLDPNIPVWETNDEFETIVRILLYGIEVVNTHHTCTQSFFVSCLKSSYLLDRHITHVATSHGLYDSFSPATLEYLGNTFIGHVDYWTYVAEKNRKPLDKMGMLTEGNHRKINNGMLRPVPKPIERGSLGINPDSFVFCLISRALVEKGWLEAVEATKGLREQINQDIHLILVGAGPAYDLLRKQELPSYIHLVGFSDHAIDYYGISNVAMLPSSYASESAPLTLIEALMLGLPCIATDIGDIREMLTKNDAVAGLIIELHNGIVSVPELAKAMQTLYQSPQKYFEAHSIALDISSRYEIEQVARQYCEVFEQKCKIERQAERNLRNDYIKELPAQIELLKRFYKGTNCPKVTIVVPNYNHKQYLQQRLDSIYNQTYRNFEVLLLDDCSSDDSIELLQQYANNYPATTRTMLNSQNSGGVFHQWRKGILEASSDLVWIAESDDYCDIDFLQTVLPAFDNPEVAVSYASYWYIQENQLNPNGFLNYVGCIDETRWHHPYECDGRKEVTFALGIRNTIPNASGAVFRINKSMPLLNDNAWPNMRICGDWLFYLHMLLNHRIAYSNLTRSYFRFHTQKKSAGTSTYQTESYYREHAFIAETLVNLYKVPPYTLQQMYTFLLAFFKEQHPGHSEAILREWFNIEILLSRATHVHSEYKLRYCEAAQLQHPISIIGNPLSQCNPEWSYEKQLVYLGNNSGNLAFVEAVRQQVIANNEVRPVWQQALENNWDNTTTILPAANWIIAGSNSVFMQQLISFMDATDGILTCAGLGAQSSKELNTPQKLVNRISNECKRFLAMLSERAVSIGIRGQFTADCLELLGIHNYRIIGCPSCYAYLDGKYPPLPTATSEKVLFHVTTGNKYETKLVNLGMKENAKWIMQMLTELPELAAGAPLKKYTKRPYTVDARYPGLSSTPEALQTYMQKNAKLFCNLQDWSAYHKEQMFSFSTGTRFHGNMLALRNGIPALWITHDSRTIELVEALHLPHVSYRELDEANSFSDLLKYCNYTDFYRYYPALTQNYIDFLNENRLDNQFYNRY